MPQRTQSQEFPSLDTHPRNASCDQKFEEIDRRLEKLEKAEWRGEIEKVNDKLTALSLQFATLNGKIAGAIAVGSAIGGVASTLIQFALK